MVKLTYKFVGEDANGQPIFENLPVPANQNRAKARKAKKKADTQHNSQLERAVAFARAGFSIFPCWECDGIDPNTGKPKKMKDPRTYNGFYGATTNEDMVRIWFGTLYPNALIGIPCKAANIAVVDIDQHPDAEGVVKEDGFKSLAERGIELPPTVANKTLQNNGEHWIYQRPDEDEFPSRKLLPGVEIKADGYIIGWGNLGPEDLQGLTPFPIGLLKALEREKRPNSNTQSSPTSSRAQAFEVDLKREYELAREWLDYIDPDDRDIWNNVGLSLYGTFADDGFDLWDNWSSRSAKYNKTRTQQEQWADFAKEPRASGIGLLRTLALKGGWNPGGSVNGARYEPGSNSQAPGSSAGPEDKGEQAPPSGEARSPKGGAPDLKARPFVWQDPATIPPRRWIYGRHYIADYASATLAQGAVGKSSLVIVEALSIITGRPLLDVKPNETGSVWIFNLEDPIEEMQRRVTSAMLEYRISPEEVEGRLFINSGRDTPLVLAEQTPTGMTICKPVEEALVEQLIARDIRVLIIDPFVSCHRVRENDNDAIDMVAKAWGRIAGRAHCSVELVHHTRKLNGNAEPTMDDGRGASALAAAVRSGRILARMSKDEADDMLQDPEDRGQYFKVLDGKPNLAPLAGSAAWYRMMSVELGNGDNIGVCARCTDLATAKPKDHKKRRTKAERVFAEAFNECVEIFPIEHFDKDAGVDVIAVDRDKLRLSFIRWYGGLPRSAERQMNRVWDKLCDTGAYATENTPTQLLIWRR